MVPLGLSAGDIYVESEGNILGGKWERFGDGKGFRVSVLWPLIFLAGP